MESAKVLLENMLIEALKMYSSHTPSYYAIDLPSRNSNSLASALDLSKRDLFEVLQIVGGDTKLVKVFKGELVPGKAEAYHTFLVNTHELPISYIDKSTSKCCRQRNKQLLFIGLGMFDSENKNSRPVDQLYHYTPEFLAENEFSIVAGLARSMEAVLYSTKKNESTKNLITPTRKRSRNSNQDSSNPEKTRRVSASNSTTSTNSTSPPAVAVALATDDPKEIWKSETVKMWSDWMERLNIYSDNESLSTIPLCEEDNGRYCLLRKLRVPFVPKILQIILHEIMLLAGKFPDLQINTIHPTDISIETIIALPKTTARRFQNKRSRAKEIVESLPRLLVDVCQRTIRSAPPDERDQLIKNEEKKMAKRVLHCIGVKYKEVFLEVAKGSQFKLTNQKKLDRFQTAALFVDLSLNKKQRIRLRSRMNFYLGWRVFASDKAVKKLYDNFIKPHWRSWKDDEGKDVEFWEKPLEEVVLNRLKSHFDKNHDSIERVKRIDIAMGGDHGAKTFSSAIKIIMLDSNGKCIHSAILGINEILCKKDSYQILQQTIAERQNRMVADLKRKQIIVTLAEGVVNVRIATAQDTRPGRNNLTIPLRIFLVGDLKFLCFVLGKVNMDGHWCIWCNLDKSHWKDSGHPMGELWTVASYKAHRIQHQNSSRNAKQGVVSPMLLDCIEPRDIISPVLHTELGLPNDLFDHMFLCIDLNMEVFSDDLLFALENYLVARDDPDITDTETRSLKKELKGLMDKRTWQEKPLRNSVWTILKAEGVDPSAYHGGKLTGPNLRTLMSKSGEINNQILDLVFQQQNRRGVAGDDDSIRDLFKRYTRIFTLLDDLFSLAYAPCGTLTDEQLLRAERLIKCVLKEWRALGMSMGKPKVHLLEDHMLTFMQRFKGLSEYSEDFIEQYHQHKKRNAENTMNMRDVEKSQTYYAQIEELKLNDDVKFAEKDFNDNKTRIIRATNLNARREVKTERRNEVFAEAWGEYDDEAVPLGDWLY